MTDEWQELHEIKVSRGFYHDSDGSVREATRSERVLWAMIERLRQERGLFTESPWFDVAAKSIQLETERHAALGELELEKKVSRALQAERDRLRAALERIANPRLGKPDPEFDEARRIARETLTDQGGQ